MGSQSSEHIAYIAGFLDGDGSLMLQIKKRSDSSRGVRFMATICLYQDSRYEQHLRWMKKILGVGYISTRNDGMSELRVQGYQTVHAILAWCQPYIRFKQIQCKSLMQSCELLIKKKLGDMTESDLKQIVSHIVAIQTANYDSKKRKSKEELYDLLGLTP